LKHKDLIYIFMEIQTYSSFDFNISCVLKCFGFDLLEIKKDRKKTIWCFKRTERLDEILHKYWQGTLTVNVVEFLSVQRFIKSSLHNQ